jgi:hypothetical protein
MNPGDLARVRACRNPWERPAGSAVHSHSGCAALVLRNERVGFTRVVEALIGGRVCRILPEDLEAIRE